MSGASTTTSKSGDVSHRLAAAGRALRDKVPRGRHAEWKPPRNRADPLSLLADSDQHRLPELVPIRYGRMSKSAFTFLRGAAAILAADLARTPTIGLSGQADVGGHIEYDCAFAATERNLLF